ncbi:TetR/AcrR family transcriptional regulator [Atopobacter sp. AH10]|uniref:TetR/AcrR family transcriptional regulator n=1 Tax=Atopobacter sp. AH10 TaxID=2315861 RepID=UPI000EF19F37|nr:TetR/AcrR family transcriptional regulator [Atopobacter sp. AH10]RLK62729.1 TetR/AcrR family transcriptional regulator [Atopobacter sp. AH10]
MDNKENTRNKIISVASKLFITKGYEETRISDIINGLDGLTKGAIYHYFESKEDIFNSVVSEIGSKNIQIFEEIKRDKSLLGAEKLIKIVKSSFDNKNMEAITRMSPNLLDNPKLLSAFIIEIRDITIPRYIQPIINEGIADGSIRTKYPNETAEMIAVLLNLWLNPLIWQNEQIKVSNKMEVINMMLEKFGVKLFDEELISKMED